MAKFFGIRTVSAIKASSKIATIYAFIGALWIMFSDQAILLFFKDPETITRLQTLKGWFFVLVSAIIIASLAEYQIRCLRHHDAKLREIAQGISVATGGAFFSSLTKHLARALDVDCAMILTIEDHAAPTLKPLAVSFMGLQTDGVECSLTESPCGKVLQQRRIISTPREVAKEYPNCLLKGVKVEGFIGVPLIGSRGASLGLLAIMHSKPIERADFAEEALSLYSIRVAVELEREKTEATLRENEALLRVIFDEAFQFMGLLKADGTLIKINRRASEFINARDWEVLGKPLWETPWWSHSREEQERLREAIASAARGEFVRFQTTHRTLQGKIIPIDFSLKPVTDNKGNVVLLVPEGREIC